MDKQQLIKLFPEATITQHQIDSTDYLSIPVHNEWLSIPIENLTSREIELLMHLTANNPTQTQTPWAQFILANGSLPKNNESTLRLIQMVIEFKGTDIELSFWKDSISHLFSDVLEIIFITENKCLVIQGNSSSSILTQTEMDGYFQTLEDDYSINISAYVGQFWSINTPLKRIWEEELDIFDSQSKHITQSVVSLSNLALLYYTEKGRINSAILSELYNQLESQSEWIEVIRALWKNQRNLTETAKSLYLHRNTLQYRIDRFEEQTHLGLKEINDLTLAYLITLMKK